MNRTRTQSPASGRLALTFRRRHASWLRPLSLLLAVCCFWSFAGASITIAAVSDHGKTMGRLVPRPFPHAPAFHTPSSAFSAAPALFHRYCFWCDRRCRHSDRNNLGRSRGGGNGSSDSECL